MVCCILETFKTLHSSDQRLLHAQPASWPAEFDLLRPGSQLPLLFHISLSQAPGTNFHGFLVLVQLCHKSTLYQLPSPRANQLSSVCL